jgi:hypothetical protein
MTAGVVAARADLDLGAVEDLRLAVDELCLTLMGPTGANGRLHLSFEWDAEMVEISCTLEPDSEAGGGGGGDQDSQGRPSQLPGQAERLRQELSTQILDALVDEHEETERDGRPHAWLRMRRVTTEVE